MASVLKCGDITAVTLLSFQVQFICLFPLTFRQPCLRRTRWPKCHYEIYSCERWVLEWREGVCSQVGKEQMNLTVQWFSIFSLSFLEIPFGCLSLPFPCQHCENLPPFGKALFYLGPV